MAPPMSTPQICPGIFSPATGSYACLCSVDTSCDTTPRPCSAAFIAATVLWMNAV
jgi:hypothetical protein